MFYSAAVDCNVCWTKYISTTPSFSFNSREQPSWNGLVTLHSVIVVTGESSTEVLLLRKIEARWRSQHLWAWLRLRLAKNALECYLVLGARQKAVHYVCLIHRDWRDIIDRDPQSDSKTLGPQVHCPDEGHLIFFKNWRQVMVAYGGCVRPGKGTHPLFPDQ